jgi:hypothetical protein
VFHGGNETWRQVASVLDGAMNGMSERDRDDCDRDRDYGNRQSFSRLFGLATGLVFALMGLRTMELEILRIMKQAAGTRFSYKEIGKLVDRDQYHENAHYARPVLEKLTGEGLIWKDEAYYLYPTDEQKTERRRKEGKVKSSAIQSHSLPDAK